jgi:RIO kinase 3
MFLFHSKPNEVVPAECAVKIFKTTLSKFRNRCQYVRGDVRFFKDEFKKHNPRKIMKIWAEKEMINLKRFVSS